MRKVGGAMLKLFISFVLIVAFCINSFSIDLQYNEMIQQDSVLEYHLSQDISSLDQSDNQKILSGILVPGSIIIFIFVQRLVILTNSSIIRRKLLTPVFYQSNYVIQNPLTS